MLLEPKTKTEYHDNGALFFTEITAEIAPGYLHLYEGKNTMMRKLIDNKEVAAYVVLFREKYYDNGQFAWRLEWDKQGIAKDTKTNQYRKDGTIIQY